MMTRERGYEALLILKSAGTEQDMARHAAHLEEPIKKAGGRLESSQNMGRRKLAFRISRQTEGYYYLLRFQAPTVQVAEIERRFRLNDTVIRFMILDAAETTLPTLSSARAPSAPAHAMASTRSER